MTIFTGPVLREDDPLYRKVRIPREYWKIAAYVKPDGGLVSAAFLVSQAKLIEPVVRTEGTKAAAVAETFQTTVADIERLTGLDFGRLRQVDVKRRAGVSFSCEASPLTGNRWTLLKTSCWADESNKNMLETNRNASRSL